ncbi:MAG: oxidoreductase, partial [Alphaproteobacteria bacterium]
GIASERADRQDDGSDRMLDPDAIAEAYLQFHNQHRSAWAWEVELRPWVETF